MALALLCVAGCSRVASDARDARNRHLRRALAAKQAQDIDRAIALCEKALVRRPGLALAHRELGLMLDNYRGDPLGALYHYRRYLELRPDSPQREAVAEQMRKCRASLAAETAEFPAEFKRELRARDERLRKLEQEVAAWREQAGGSGAPVRAASPPAPEPAAAVIPAPPAERTHVVQPGETLATISAKHYGSPAHWQGIFNANRDKLADANNLRVGTRLAIPNE